MFSFLNSPLSSTDRKQRSSFVSNLSAFVWFQLTFSFHVSKHIRLSGTSPEMLSNVLARLSTMGTDYIQLNKFATHHRGQTAGLVLQAFLGALQNYLHCYRATVLSVDGKYFYIYVILCSCSTWASWNNRKLTLHQPPSSILKGCFWY